MCNEKMYNHLKETGLNFFFKIATLFAIHPRFKLPLFVCIAKHASPQDNLSNLGQLGNLRSHYKNLNTELFKNGYDLLINQFINHIETYKNNEKVLERIQKKIDSAIINIDCIMLSMSSMLCTYYFSYQMTENKTKEEHLKFNSIYLINYLYSLTLTYYDIMYVVFPTKNDEEEIIKLDEEIEKNLKTIIEK